MIIPIVLTSPMVIPAKLGPMSTILDKTPEETAPCSISDTVMKKTAAFALQPE